MGCASVIAVTEMVTALSVAMEGRTCKVVDNGRHLLLTVLLLVWVCAADPVSAGRGRQVRP